VANLATLADLGAREGAVFAAGVPVAASGGQGVVVSATARTVPGRCSRKHLVPSILQPRMRVELAVWCWNADLVCARVNECL
jgi:hypothetical protein